MRRGYAICRFFAELFFTFLFRGRAFNLRNVPTEGGVLLVCNHQSFFDPLIATLALPRECHYMARDSLFRNPIFRRVIEYLNAFPVKRGTGDVGAIKETLRRLKRGGLVTVFPEATRTLDGGVRPMQPGVVLIARKARVPLVPAMILGAFEAWPRHAKLPHTAPLIVAYGKPISPEELKGLGDDEAINILRDRILVMMQRYREHPLVRGKLRPPAGGR